MLACPARPGNNSQSTGSCHACAQGTTQAGTAGRLEARQAPKPQGKRTGRMKRAKILRRKAQANPDVRRALSRAQEIGADRRQVRLCWG